MINILIPLAGTDEFFNKSEYPYPKPLIEIDAKTMIEHVVENYNRIKEDKQYIFIVNSEDCRKHHLDDVLNLLTDHTCQIIKLDSITKGAACSALMAIEHINNDVPLIIANADQLFDIDLEEIVLGFRGADGGVITFNSVHPRWSYARTDEDNFIIETAEKKPLSKHAIAGFYYFNNGSDFVASAMSMIKKDANVNGLYYISPALNEMILKNKRLLINEIENDQYHTFYTPQKILEYERIK